MAKKKPNGVGKFADPAVARRNVVLLAILTAFLHYICYFPVIEGSATLSQFRLRSYDLVFNLVDWVRVNISKIEFQETPDQIAVVGIDDQSLETFGRWPWPRSRMAKLISSLKKLGAKTIAVDVLFSEPEWNPLEGLEELKQNLPPELESLEIPKHLESVQEFLEWMEGLPPEYHKLEGVHRLRERFLPGYQDRALVDAIREADNVVLGMAVQPAPAFLDFEKSALSGRLQAFANQWLGPLKSKQPPANALELLKRLVESYPEEERQAFDDPEELQELWEEGAFAQEILDRGTAFRAVQVGVVDDEIVPEGQRKLKTQLLEFIDTRKIGGVTLPLAPQVLASKALGYLNNSTMSSAIGITRKVQVVLFFDGLALPSLSMAALAKYLGGELVINAVTLPGGGELGVAGISILRTEQGVTRILHTFDIGHDNDVFVGFHGQKMERSKIVDMGASTTAQDGSTRLDSVLTVLKPVPVMPTVSAGDVMLCFEEVDQADSQAVLAQESKRSELSKVLKDRLVFVGATALGLIDRKETPAGIKVPGVRTHASLADNVLKNRVLRSGWIEELLTLFLFLLALGFVTFSLTRLDAGNALYAFIFVVMASVAVAVFLFQRQMVIFLFDILLPISVFFAVAMAYLNRAENREKAWIDNMFKRYVSADYVEQIKANKGELDLNGKEAIITPFFSDMAKFSTISESFSAEGLFGFLGEYLGEMADILDEYGGTLDKFEGDAVVAFFGAPIHFEDHAAKACLASLRMQERIRELERDWRTSHRYPELHQLAEKVGHWFPIRVRIGLNTGPCATGHLGTAERGNYTMMGDTVNLAARLEAAGKQYGITLTVSEDTYLAAKDVVLARPVDVIQVVGRTVGTKIYEVVGTEETVSDTKKKVLLHYQEGMKWYFDWEWQKALTEFEKALKLDPSDRPSQIFVERCGGFVQHAPPEDWNFVHVLTEK